MRRPTVSLALALFTLGPCPDVVAAEVVRLATLEWPPHSSATIENEGKSVHRVRKALAREGISLDVQFRPWRRAVEGARRGDDGIVGFLPEYESDDSRAEWLLSSSIGESTLGFVERSDRPFNWRRLEDLAGFRIGVVRGYINEARFDALASRGTLTVREATDDLTNLRKLAAGRLDLAVIDAEVLRHLIARHPELRGANPPLQFNARILEIKTLHVAFRRDEEGRRVWATLERALAATEDPD